MDLNQAVPNWKGLGELHRLDQGKDFYNEVVEPKQRNYLTGDSLSCCFIWKRLVDYLGLVSP